MNTPGRMNATEVTPRLQRPGVWVRYYTQTTLPDGRILLSPGPLQLRGCARNVAKASGVSEQVLVRLAEAGFIRRARPSPGKTYYYYQEIEDLIRQTEQDPDYWTKVRWLCYLTGQDIKTAEAG